MQELLGRIADLDPTASLGIRVIACFDELVIGNVNIHGLLATAAALAGCPAGYRNGTTTCRVSTLGEPLTGAAPTSEPPTPAHHLDVVDTDAQVWLERDGDALPNDAIILERLALAIAVRLAGAAPERTRRDVPVLLDRDAGVDERREAASRIGLTPGTTHRAIATALFSEWTRHPGWPGDVVATPLGTIHVLIAPASVDAASVPASPCGLGVHTDIDGLADSFRTALIALRLCEHPELVVDAERYGGLIHLLADANPTAANPDVERLTTVMAHPWSRPTVAALVASSSARQAARSLDIHHSTVQARIELISDTLGFDPLDGLGRARLGVAFLTWRMHHSRALELPPPR